MDCCSDHQRIPQGSRYSRARRLRRREIKTVGAKVARSLSSMKNQTRFLVKSRPFHQCLWLKISVRWRRSKCMMKIAKTRVKSWRFKIMKNFSDGITKALEMPILILTTKKNMKDKHLANRRNQWWKKRRNQVWNYQRIGVGKSSKSFQINL